MRPATRADVDALFDIRCSVRENHQSRAELDELGVTPERVAVMVEADDHVAIVADGHDGPVGFAIARIADAYLFALFVRPAREGCGVGRALLESVEATLAGRGAETAWLVTGADPTLRARGFYERLGWCVDGATADDELRMVKPLGNRSPASRLAADVARN